MSNHKSSETISSQVSTHLGEVKAFESCDGKSQVSEDKFDSSQVISDKSELQFIQDKSKSFEIGPIRAQVSSLAMAGLKRSINHLGTSLCEISSFETISSHLREIETFKPQVL